MLLLLPQRYVFSSKSQLKLGLTATSQRCCCYHKGTYFQANHNVTFAKIELNLLLLLPQRYVFSSKSQPILILTILFQRCCCYHKGTYFQANHNSFALNSITLYVVVATTKVRIFKQITTAS